MPSYIRFPVCAMQTFFCSEISSTTAKDTLERFSHPWYSPGRLLMPLPTGYIAIEAFLNN